jgi:plastocyanin
MRGPLRLRSARMLPGVVAAGVVASGIGAAVALAQGGTTVNATSGNTFNPNAITVTQGDSITIANPSGAGTHNLFQGSTRLENDGSGWSHPVTLNTPGQVVFYCSLHGSASGGMRVVVTVNAASTQPGSTTPAPAPGGGSPTGNPPTGSTPTPADTTAPTATQLRASGTLRRTVVRLRLSEKATVTARLRRRGSTRTLTRVTRSLDAGNARLTIRKRLTAGKRYRVALTIRDAAGNVTRRTVSFTAHR